MDQNAPDAQQISCKGNPSGAILEQGSPQAPPLPCRINGKSRQDGNRYRIWHIAAEPTRRRQGRNAAGGQGIICDNTIPLAGNEGTGRTGHLIGTRPADQPMVKVSLAALKPIQEVMSSQWNRRRQRHRDRSQGAGCSKLRRKRSLGAAGWSRRAKKAP